MGGIQGLGFGILFVLMGGVDGVLEGLWVVGGEARRASVPWQYIGALQQCNHIIRGAVTAHSSTAECSRIIRALLKCIEHWSTAKVQSHRRQRHCGSACAEEVQPSKAEIKFLTHPAAGLVLCQQPASCGSAVPWLLLGRLRSIDIYI